MILSTFQMMLVYKHCFMLSSLLYAHHHILANTAFLTGTEKVTQVSCEHRTGRNKVNQNNMFHLLLPRFQEFIIFHRHLAAESLPRMDSRTVGVDHMIP